MYPEEEKENREGHCDECGEYCYYLTKCPEHCHEFKHHYFIDNELCPDCCQDFLDYNECCMSCGDNFIEKHFIEKFEHKCDELGLIKSKKSNVYLNNEKTFFLTFNKDITSKLKNDVTIDQPLIVDEYCVVKNENEIHRYEMKDYNRLYDILRYKFKEDVFFSLVLSETTNENKMGLLKIGGNLINGFLAPHDFDLFDTQDEFKSRMNNRFTDYMLKGIDVFGIGNEIEKHCTIPQRYCHEHIKYQGKDSYFIAFPFNPVNYSRFVSRLKSKLGGKGMKVILPIGENDDFPSTGIVFCKLCKMILSTNSIICEITEINQNVMFEAGYAIGLGKYCSFLVDKSYDEKKRHELELISDQLKIYYIDEDDCADNFNIKEENISHYLPIRPVKFENKSIMEKKSNKIGILLLVPEDDRYQKIETEIKTEIENYLNSIGDRLSPPLIH